MTDEKDGSFSSDESDSERKSRRTQPASIYVRQVSSRCARLHTLCLLITQEAKILVKQEVIQKQSETENYSRML